jgi:hypothetical protein
MAEKAIEASQEAQRKQADGIKMTMLEDKVNQLTNKGRAMPTRCGNRKA